MNNLINIVKGEYSTSTNVWKNIPYPVGFTVQNSIVIIQSSGDQNTGNVSFKINLSRNKYSAVQIDGYISYVPYFIFIKSGFIGSWE